ncbi:MAG: S4 domain-containing protein [Alphaproteobacteria bacterium]|nr:S4 domain-containing protein [Alphaproteobacteria bacterium]
MLLKRFTLLPRSEIEALEPLIGQANRTVQKTLAQSITAMIHGTVDCDRVAQDSETLFYGKITDISADTRREMLSSDTGLPTLKLLMGESRAVVDILVELGLCESKSEARRQMTQKAIRINDELVTEDRPFTLADTGQPIAKISRGKKNLGLILC